MLESLSSASAAGCREKDATPANPHTLLKITPVKRTIQRCPEANLSNTTRLNHPPYLRPWSLSVQHSTNKGRGTRNWGRSGATAQSFSNLVGGVVDNRRSQVPPTSDPDLFQTIACASCSTPWALRHRPRIFRVSGIEPSLLQQSEGPAGDRREGSKSEKPAKKKLRDLLATPGNARRIVRTSSLPTLAKQRRTIASGSR